MHRDQQAARPAIVERVARLEAVDAVGRADDHVLCRNGNLIAERRIPARFSRTGAQSLLLGPRAAAANEQVGSSLGVIVLLARRLGGIARHPIGARRADHEYAAREIERATEAVAARAVVGEQLLPF